MVPAFVKSESEKEKIKLKFVMFCDDTKEEKPHPKSVDKHLNQTAIFGEQELSHYYLHSFVLMRKLKVFAGKLDFF